jgi:uncharacterized membrane protein YhaH (DUF805 family)
MVSKSDILNNLREYSSDQVVEAINAGVVTIYELSKSGNLTPLMRKRIEQKLAAPLTSITHEPQQSIPIAEQEITATKEVIPNIEISIPEPKEYEIHTEIIIPEAPIFTTKTETTFSNDTKSLTETTNINSSKGMFNKPFSFKGRIRRLEYGISAIIYLVWYFIIQAMMEAPNPSIGASVFVLISLIPMIWFLWAQNCKRCHDRGNSGWYQIIPFYFFILLFGDGDEGNNEYGDNPKK